MKPETYSVASNHMPEEENGQALHVLFSGESQTKPGHILGPKVYDFFLMHLVLSGKGSFTLEGTEYKLAAGQTFLIRPGQLISYESDQKEPWRYRWIAFKGRDAEEAVSLAGFRRKSGQVATLRDNRRASLLYHAVYRTLKRGQASLLLASAGYLQLLLSLYAENASQLPGEPPLPSSLSQEQLHQRVVRYLSTQYAQPVSMEGMAEFLGYNRAYLSRIFKRQTGLSPISFLLRLRLDRAKLLLRERPELTIEQVAASVGLQDALYFSKQFKGHHGLSPTAYRREMWGNILK